MKHYLDHHATTPLDPRVAEAMAPLWAESFGNPASVEHERGLAAAERVENARQQVALCLGAEPREIVFTSGATEANNMAVLGALRFRSKHEGRNRLIIFETEHSCVLGAAKALEVEGVEVVRLPVTTDGTADLEALEAALDERVALVCLMAANNEVGTVQPLARAAALAHHRGAWLHVDAAQAVGKIPLNVRDSDIDLLSLSGHKVYGPMGIGALFVRRRPRVRLAPLVYGGGQERGLRAGTLPLPLIAGLGTALELARQEMDQDAVTQRALFDQALQGLEGLGLEFELNGHRDFRLPGNLSVSFPDIGRKQLFETMAEHGIAVSSGSACSSHDVAPSHVLTAMGLPSLLAQQTLRIGFGRSSGAESVQALLAALEDLKGRQA